MQQYSYNSYIGVLHWGIHTPWDMGNQNLAYANVLSTSRIQLLAANVD